MTYVYILRNYTQGVGSHVSTIIQVIHAICGHTYEFHSRFGSHVSTIIKVIHDICGHT